MIERGDILWIRCDPSVGVEPKKTRTCIVVSSTVANRGWQAVTVVTTVRRSAPARFLVDLGGRWSLAESRMANCSMITTYDKGRIVRRGGQVSADAMRDIDQALLLHLGLSKELFEVHEREVAYEVAKTLIPPKTRRRARSR